MYTYTAGATGLDAAMPPWVQEGGVDAWIKRLKDPAMRARVVKEMREPTNDWENLLLAAGKPDNVLLVSFDSEELKPLTGKTLAEVAKLRGKSPEETAIDLVIEDHSRIGTVYFLMSEDNVKLGLSQPWVALGFGRRFVCAGGRVPEVPAASARVRQLRALSRPLRARRTRRQLWPMRCAGCPRCRRTI